jgi:hypothetical protein
MSQLPEPGAPDQRQPNPGEVRSLALLRVLVTVLTATMILGIVALVTLLYLRLPGGASDAPAALPALPDTLRLPEGETAQAVTAGQGWWAVVTTGGDILLYGAEGALVRRVPAAELAAE